jgi:hypothetical protein
MSAVIIAFPTKQPLGNRSTKYCIDVSPVDKRGFVILDACVPLSLANDLMNLLGSYRDKPVAPVRRGVPAYDRPTFHFEMSETGAAGLVLIDACVPEQLAREFFAIAQAETTPGAAA